MFCDRARSTGWCFQCYQGVKAVAYRRGHHGWRKKRSTSVQGVSMLIKRQVATDKATLVGIPAAFDEEATKRWPALVEWLSVTMWEDGSKRRTGSVMVLAEDGVWKSWLHDRDSSRSCWVSAGTLRDLLAKVDEILGCGGGEWRADKQGGKK